MSQGRQRYGLEFTTSGYNHTLPELLDAVMIALTSLVIDASRFALVKEGVVHAYENALLKPQSNCVHQRYVKLVCLLKLKCCKLTFMCTCCVILVFVMA